MTQLPHHDAVESDTAQAFEELRGEVILTRPAVEGLTAARERIPDYSPTLGYLVEALNKALGYLDRIERSPAIRLPPDAMTAEIVKAGAAARAEDVRLLHEARDTISRSIGRVDGIVERGQAADLQLRRLIGAGVGGLMMGILMWAILPGAIARSLPASWQVPEWMAARTMGMDQRLAGERMIKTSRPTHKELTIKYRLSHRPSATDK